MQSRPLGVTTALQGHHHHNPGSWLATRDVLTLLAVPESVVRTAIRYGAIARPMRRGRDFAWSPEEVERLRAHLESRAATRAPGRRGEQTVTRARPSPPPRSAASRAALLERYREGDPMARRALDTMRYAQAPTDVRRRAAADAWERRRRAAAGERDE